MDMQYRKKIMEDEVLNIIKSHLPSYMNACIDDTIITRIFSGTNTIFKVVNTANSSTVIFRKFGNNELISPVIERRNYQLVSNSGQGPISLVERPLYRIEEYIPGDTIKRHQVEQFSENIVPSLFSFHNLMEGSGELTTLTLINSWTQILKNKASSYINAIQSNEKMLLIHILESINNYEIEAKSLLPKCDSLKFCHNDFSYGNIINSNGRFLIIDYEYAGLGHPSIDLATYIIEGMFDFSTPAYQYFPEDEMSITSQLNMIGAYSEIARLDPDDLWNDVCKSKAVVNYLGMIWAACMYNPGDVSMLNYSINRLDLYNKYKRQC